MTQKMQLGPRTIEPRACSTSLVLGPGQTLKIETTPGGEEVFELKNPERNGETTWTCVITVQLIEKPNHA